MLCALPRLSAESDSRSTLPTGAASNFDELDSSRSRRLARDIRRAEVMTHSTDNEKQADENQADGNQAGRGTARGERENVSTAIPPAAIENKERRRHEHSHAAHLETGEEKPHTKPAIDMRESKLAGKRKEP
jgi:hypothetical protein